MLLIFFGYVGCKVGVTIGLFCLILIVCFLSIFLFLNSSNLLIKKLLSSLNYLNLFTNYCIYCSLYLIIFYLLLILPSFYSLILIT